MSENKAGTSRRYIIIGPGAVGGTIAAELSKAGIPVVAASRGEEYKAISTSGIRYLTPAGVENVHVDAVGAPEDVDLREGDILVLATKSQHTAEALRDWAWLPVTKADGTIGVAGTHVPLVTLQNSISNERTALRWFKHVYGGVLAFPVDKKNVGEVISYSTSLLGLVWIGTYPTGSDDLAEAIAEDLRGARLGTAVVENIADFKATKLAYNTVNAIEPIFGPSELRDELKAELFDEAWRVLSAAGFSRVDLWDGDAQLHHDLLHIGEVQGLARSGNSTWQSYSRGATIETDFLNGDIVLESRVTGVPAPFNEAVQERIRHVLAGRAPVRSGDDELSVFLDAVRAGALAATH